MALIGYARCSTDKQDLAAQQAALVKLGVAPDRIYTDHGLTGTNRTRPGLDQALAAVRSGDTLVVPKLDRLARSVPDARDIADSLVKRGVKLALNATVYDPSDPITARGVGHAPASYTTLLSRDGLQGARIGILREPKVKTGKRTMFYMALSLALTAGDRFTSTGMYLYKVSPVASSPQA